MTIYLYAHFSFSPSLSLCNELAFSDSGSSSSSSILQLLEEILFSDFSIRYFDFQRLDMEIKPLLVAAQSDDALVRTKAENHLKQLLEKNLPQFLLSLSRALADEDEPSELRQLAGILLMGCFYSENIFANARLRKKWIAINTASKSQIKLLLLRTLVSSALEARHASAKAIASCASIDFPFRQWPELVGSLLSNITQQASTGPLKESSLETLSYVISRKDLVQEEVNLVLRAVVQTMNQSENSLEVRLALLHALALVQKNFENVMERADIIKAICKTALSKEAKISQAAIKCLVSIKSVYNEVLEQQNMETLFQLTSKAIEVHEESFALQAIEFFGSIFDRDIKLQETDNALRRLVPVLLENLLKQGDDQDQGDDLWNISMAGGTCLGLVARTLGNAIVPLVTPFVQAKIDEPNWRSWEAATYAFGSILEGPTVEELGPLVSDRLEFLLNVARNENEHLRYKAAWTLSRIFEFLYDPDGGYPFISAWNLPTIVNVLLEATGYVPNVAEKICGAIYHLAQGYEDSVAISSPLSPHLTAIIEGLLVAAERSDANVSKLRAAAYKTLNEVVICSNFVEASNVIGEHLPVIMNKLDQALNMPTESSLDRERQAEIKAFLSGVLQVIIQKLNSSDPEVTHTLVLHNADQIKNLFARCGARLCHLCGYRSHFPALCRDLWLWRGCKKYGPEDFEKLGSWKRFHNALMDVIQIKHEFFQATKDLMLNTVVFHASFIELQRALEGLSHLVIHECYNPVETLHLTSIKKKLWLSCKKLITFWSKVRDWEALERKERRVLLMTIHLRVTWNEFLEEGEKHVLPDLLSDDDV